jgi:hypothetical protein
MSEPYRDRNQYLYVPARGFEGADRKLPACAWVNGDRISDDTNPRTLENPYTLTYEETDPEKPYIIVGLIDGHLLDLDVDVGDGHDVTFDGEIEDIRTLNGTLAFRSASGGPHQFLKFDRDHDGLTGVAGVDIQGDMSYGLGVITSPFHHPEYTITAEPTERVYFDDVVDHEEATLNKGFGVDLLEQETSDEPEPKSDGFEDFDADEYTPTATHSNETTSDARDVYAGLNDLNAQRVADRTIVHRWNDDASTSDGHRAFHPSWGPNCNGTANIVNRQIWQDTGSGGYGGPVVMALIDLGELNPQKASPRQARGELFGKGVDHLRELGFDLPEYTGPTGQGEHVAVLPNAPIERAQSGLGATWDWRGKTTTLTTDDVRERTHDAIASAYERGDRVLIDAIMSAGKTYGSIKAARQTGEPVTFLTGRGRDEQYEQVQEWCDERGLTSLVLPTISDCDTYSGRYEGEHEHAEQQKKIVRRWYDKGATGKDIHMHAEEELGHPLVCQGPAGARCTYKVKWEALEPEEYDVLIGHYNHAHVQSVVKSRTLVIDEFPDDTYISQFGDGLASAVTTFLKRHEHVEELPDDYADLMDARSDDARRADALSWFLDRDVDRDGTLAFEQGGHANAPIATFTLLAAAENDLGNGFEYAELPGHYGGKGGDGIGVYDREKGHVHLLTPPDIRYSSGTVALDGTPVPDMWDLVLGENLNHRQVLTDGERAEYITESQNLDIVRTTEYVKPGGLAKNVYLEEDRALLTGIADRHGENPDLITTKTAEEEYERDENGILEAVNEREHHGNIKGSNKFADSRLGAVLYSRHFGDGYVQLWGAFAGERVERGEGRGVDLEYSGIGEAIHQHMTHHETMQAVMRFGRDGKGATVYVHTNTLPDWVPVAGEGRVPRVWSDGMKQILEAANDYDQWRTSDLADHPVVEIGERQIRGHLHTLADRGLLTVRVEGRGFVWQDDGLHRVNEHGDVALPTLDTDDLSDNEVAELGRIESYTWDFRKTSEISGGQVTPTTDDERHEASRGGQTGGSLETGD